MATVRKFCCNDLLRTTSVNLDHLVITTELSFYLKCLAKRRYIYLIAVAPRNRIIGFMIGKIEGDFEEETKSAGENWKGLAVNVNVASEYRRRGYGMKLMRLFEQLLVDKMLLSPRDCEYYTFVHVECENTPAKKMFEQLGYEVTNIRKEFYLSKEDEEMDSYEMRKELSEEEPDVLHWPGYTQRTC